MLDIDSVETNFGVIFNMIPSTFFVLVHIPFYIYHFQQILLLPNYFDIPIFCNFFNRIIYWMFWLFNRCNAWKIYFISIINASMGYSSYGNFPKSKIGITPSIMMSQYSIHTLMVFLPYEIFNLEKFCYSVSFLNCYYVCFLFYEEI